MAYILSVALYLSNALLVFINRSKVFGMILLIVLWLFFSGSYNNPDYNNYQRSFSSVVNREVSIWDSSEPGYYIIQKIIGSVTHEFRYYLIVISAIGLCLIFTTVNLFTKNIGLVVLLYIICPFLIDIVQIRNFLAMSVLIFSIRYLILESIKYRKMKYLAMIIIATSIHSSFFLYAPLVFVGKKNILIRIIITTSFIGTLLLLLGIDFFPIFTEIGDLSFLENRSSYLFSRTNFGYLVSLFLTIINILIIKFTSRLITNDIKLIEKKQQRVLMIIEIINLYSISFIPFFFLQSTFSRLIRNILVINFIGLGVVGDNLPVFSTKRTLLLIVSLIYTVIWGFLEIYRPYGDIWVPLLFQYNWIFN